MRLSVALLLLAFALELAWAFAPLRVIVGQVTSDDTFLYLTVARNWAALGFPTFDGTTPTNGFQPLWGSILARLAHLAPGRVPLLRAALALSALLNLATGLLILRAARRLSGDAVAATAAGAWAFYMLHPKAISGMEDPLHGALFAAAVCVWLAEHTPRNLLALGLLLTATTFCRLESGIVAAILAMPILIRRSRAAEALVLPGVILLGVYLIWNHVQFGAPFPVSGQAKMYWAWASPSWSEAFLAGARALAESWSLPAGFHYAAWSPAVLSILWMGIVAPMVARGIATRPAIRTKLLLLLAAVGVDLLVTTLLLHRFAQAPWYWQPLRVVFALAMGHVALLRIPAGRGIALALFAAALLLHTFDLSRQRTGADTYLGRLDAAVWIDSTAALPPGAIGAWNAGELGYFCTTRQVVNLDGLVQGRGYVDRVLRPRAWRVYFRERGIRCLVDLNEEDLTQTHGLRWDPARNFRGLVPLDSARVVRRFGPVVVVDLGGW